MKIQLNSFTLLAIDLLFFFVYLRYILNSNVIVIKNIHTGKNLTTSWFLQ